MNTHTHTHTQTNTHISRPICKTKMSKYLIRGKEKIT